MSEGAGFGFVQFEFPWALGPTDGRYVVRAGGEESPGEPEHVIVLATLGAPERRRLLRGRRPEPVAPEPAPTPVSTARATVIRAAPLERPDAVRAWMGEDPEGRAGAALAVLGRVLAAHRVATADPHVREPGREHALVVRIGHGAGEAVAEGRWAEAVTLPPPRGRRGKRSSALRPQERLAALLAGRERPLACEELILRARLDLDHEREREAALQLDAALGTALAELPEGGELGARRTELETRGDAVRAAAKTARTGPLSAAERTAIAEALARLEAALRARAAARG